MQDIHTAPMSRELGAFDPVDVVSKVPITGATRLHNAGDPTHFRVGLRQEDDCRRLVTVYCGSVCHS